MALAVEAKTIDGRKQRYPTVGDYWISGNTIHVRISKCKDWRAEACILIHELVEVFLVRHAGIKIEDIDQFDIEFAGEEPGASPDAPYHAQHLAAESIERVFAHMIDLDWNDYDGMLG